jgi:hypothetical protein
VHAKCVAMAVTGAPIEGTTAPLCAPYVFWMIQPAPVADVTPVEPFLTGYDMLVLSDRFANAGARPPSGQSWPERPCRTASAIMAESTAMPTKIKAISTSHPNSIDLSKPLKDLRKMVRLRSPTNGEVPSRRTGPANQRWEWPALTNTTCEK